jgi:signal transduction histidine kinase
MSKSKILVVDDTPANLQLLNSTLIEQGYQILPAISGKVALNVVEKMLPDLILLDINMPNMNGYEVCEHLKANERTRHIPVIFVSALSETFDKLKAFSVGGVDYVTKPFQTEEVLARVKTHLQLHQLQQQLAAQNKELQAALEHLKTTQTQLVESEKMASLGRLVAGVAHEINTPVGIGIMSASLLEAETKKAAEAYKNKQLKGSALKAYFETASTSSELVLKNLNRTGELVQSFKQVAVDQNCLEKRTFVIKRCIEDTLLTLKPQIKKTRHHITVNDDDSLKIDNYPGALSQIVTNMVINFLTYAHKPEEEGELRFDIVKESEQLMIKCQDDGCGIPAENLNKIFDPFFTTGRNKGGTGLGLHIVYNLVTQKLKGTINCESTEGVGTTFIISIPQN